MRMLCLLGIISGSFGISSIPQVGSYTAPTGSDQVRSGSGSAVLTGTTFTGDPSAYRAHCVLKLDANTFRLNCLLKIADFGLLIDDEEDCKSLNVY